MLVTTAEPKVNSFSNPKYLCLNFFNSRSNKNKIENFPQNNYLKVSIYFELKVYRNIDFKYFYLILKFV